MLDEVLHSGRADIISIGFVLALWAGSSATATFVNTITIAYGMRDLRGAVRSRLLALWLFLGSLLVGVVVLPLLVIGPDQLRRWLPARFDDTLGPIINAGYYPVVIRAAAARADDAVPPGPAAAAAVASRHPGRHCSRSGCSSPARPACARTSASSSNARGRTGPSRRRSPRCCSSSSSRWACCSARSSTPRSSRSSLRGRGRPRVLRSRSWRRMDELAEPDSQRARAEARRAGAARRLRRAPPGAPQRERLS